MHKKRQQKHESHTYEMSRKYKGVVCQAEACRVPKTWRFLLTPLLPLISFFYLLSSPYLPTSLLKLALQILSSPVFKTSYLFSSRVLILFLLPLSSSGSQIMVLTDPEFESSVLISSDEGASYQKYRLNFYVLSLLFHPTEEDWALAYSHDQKVRSNLMSYLLFPPYNSLCVK